MKSKFIKKQHKKCPDKKAKIHDKKEEVYINIEFTSPIDILERNKLNGNGSSKKEETFLELNRIIADKSFENDIDMEKKVPNLNKIKEKYYNMLGKKKNKTNLYPRYPKSKWKNERKKKKKSKQYLNKYNQKSQVNNKTQENFIQIINIFAYSYDKSNNININYTENKSNNKSKNRSMKDLSLNNI